MDTLEERVRLYWLDTVTVDGYLLERFVRVLQMSYTLEKVVACKVLTQGVIDRLQNVYDVLERLQVQTAEDRDDASELREPLQDLLFDVHWFHKLLERFSKEDVLVQFIRSQKLIDCLEQAHEGVDEFVDGVQRSRYGESFNRLAESTDVDFSEEAWAEAFDRDVLDVNDALMREFGASRDPERLRRLGISNPFLEFVGWELCVTNYEPKVAPWFIPSDEIPIGHHIGSGGFWRVYHATWGGSEGIAVKRMIRFDKATLLRVINTSSQLNHPHILRFYGASFPDSKCSVVFEFAKYGSLWNFRINTGRSVDIERQKQLWCLLYEAALGIHYMHQQGYVHGDLKCNSILVGDDLKAKLADFGHSFKNGDHEDVPCSAAFNWSAPECFDKTRKTERSFPSDVYSFGMCIVEALTICPPYGNLINPVVREFVRRGTLPISVSTLAPRVQKLVKKMCAREPAERMKLEGVIATLKQFADANDPDLLLLSREVN